MYMPLALALAGISSVAAAPGAVSPLPRSLETRGLHFNHNCTTSASGVPQSVQGNTPATAFATRAPRSLVTSTFYSTVTTAQPTGVETRIIEIPVVPDNGRFNAFDSGKIPAFSKDLSDLSFLDLDSLYESIESSVKNDNLGTQSTHQVSSSSNDNNSRYRESEIKYSNGTEVVEVEGVWVEKNPTKTASWSVGTTYTAEPHAMTYAHPVQAAITGSPAIAEALSSPTSSDPGSLSSTSSASSVALATAPAVQKSPIEMETSDYSEEREVFEDFEEYQPPPYYAYYERCSCPYCHDCPNKYYPQYPPYEYYQERPYPNPEDLPYPMHSLVPSPTYMDRSSEDRPYYYTSYARYQYTTPTTTYPTSSAPVTVAIKNLDSVAATTSADTTASAPATTSTDATSSVSTADVTSSASASTSHAKGPVPSPAVLQGRAVATPAASLDVKSTTNTTSADAKHPSLAADSFQVKDKDTSSGPTVSLTDVSDATLEPLFAAANTLTITQSETQCTEHPTIPNLSICACMINSFLSDDIALISESCLEGLKRLAIGQLEVYEVYHRVDLDDKWHYDPAETLQFTEATDGNASPAALPSSFKQDLVKRGYIRPGDAATAFQSAFGEEVGIPTGGQVKLGDSYCPIMELEGELILVDNCLGGKEVEELLVAQAREDMDRKKATQNGERGRLAQMVDAMDESQLIGFLDRINDDENLVIGAEGLIVDA
ncbi:hypothetical protein DFH27DRAFT_640611 [Peziza echinospora]|nr:hypothetical protein DFH27DRAFT_640611 [Peziza echinospora]